MSEELNKEQQGQASEEKAVSTHVEPAKGFEDEFEGDFIIPRVKIIQDLSPEAKDRSANVGDILNSLTKEKLNGMEFIPVFKFNNNIWWRPRKEGGGISCMARDGRVGIPTDGSPSLMCAQCRKNEFDNNKQGAEAYPVCTKYLNFFGFFRGTSTPIILSFAKTNYKEGQQMYSMAKITLQNMWNHCYKLNEKEKTKNADKWFIIHPTAAGKTTDEEREYGRQLFEMFRAKDFKVDQEDQGAREERAPNVGSAESAEF